MLRVLPERPGFTAIIIGRAMPADAVFEQSLQQKITAAGLEGRVRFIGEQPPSKVPEIVRALSLLVAPARYEGYGMTPLEAMASGVAVVASDTGVYREIIQPGVVGQVVPLGDIDSLAEAVMGATGSRDRLESMGDSARGFAESKMSLRHEVDGYSRLLDRIWRGEGLCHLKDCA
jgi:mannosyltransferase